MNSITCDEGFKISKRLLNHPLHVESSAEGYSYRYFSKNKMKIHAGTVGSTDNTIMLTDGSVAVVCDIRGINEVTSIIVQKFKFQSDLFTEPIKSSSIGIVEVCEPSSSYEEIALQDLYSKCVLLPFKKGYVALTMVHGHLEN